MSIFKCSDCGDRWQGANAECPECGSDDVEMLEDEEDVFDAEEE